MSVEKGVLMKKTFVFLTAFFIAAGFLYADGKSVFKTASKKVEYALAKGIFYNMEIIDKNNRNIQKGIVYNKNNKSRMDFSDMTTIIDGESMYMYTPKNRSAIKMSLQKATDQKGLDSFDSTKIPENAVFIKKTTMNGYSCNLIQSTENGVVTEYYLTEEFGFPTCVKTNDGGIINMTNFKFGVSDSKFSLPSDTQIADMSGASTNTGKKTNAFYDMMKDTANDTVVDGAKEAKDETVSEQKSKAKEETKTKTKETINKLFGL